MSVERFIVPPTFAELSDIFSHSGAVEATCSGEIVVYTGWKLDPDDPDGEMVEWTDPDDDE